MRKKLEGYITIEILAAGELYELGFNMEFYNNLVPPTHICVSTVTGN